MARGINKVILIGNLGADPELRYTGNGTAVCNFRLATNEVYKDQNGELVEKTEWHACVAWSRLAEICGEYLKKGSQVYIEGSLQTRQWEDKDGNTRYTTEVKAREMQILSSRDGVSASADDGGMERARPAARPAPAARPSGGGSGQRPAPPSGQPRRAPQRSEAPAGGDDYTFEPDDDLPF